MKFKKVLSFLIFSLLFLFNSAIFAADIHSDIDIEYSTHVSYIGWMDPVKNGEIAGTTGQSKQVEAIKITGSVSEDSSIEYQSHVTDIGWETLWAKDGAISGTEGQSKKLQAIRIRLTGSANDLFDVYYRAHVQDVGWLDWAKNGADAGSAGLDRRLEALQIVILSKGSEAPGEIARPFVTKNMEAVTSANTHISDIGWVQSSLTGVTLGTTGQAKKIEAIQLKYADENQSGIEYCSHIQDFGWEKEWKSNGETSGTTGKNKRLEALKIRLTGPAAQNNDIYYQVHCSDYGWLDWAKNGQSAGTTGCSKQIEAINIVIVPKDSEAPGSTFEPCITPISKNDFIGRIKGAWIDINRASNPVNSYIAGINDNYLFTGYNQTYDGVEGYYDILTANTTGGKIKLYDQESKEDKEIYLSFENIPANHLKVTVNGVTRELVKGDTTDGIHYTFSGLKQYGQLLVIELKSKPGLDL